MKKSWWSIVHQSDRGQKISGTRDQTKFFSSLITVSSKITNQKNHKKFVKIWIRIFVIKAKTNSKYLLFASNLNVPSHMVHSLLTIDCGPKFGLQTSSENEFWPTYSFLLFAIFWLEIFNVLCLKLSPIWATLE